MGFKDKVYGVTWKTTMVKQATTVWFKEKQSINKFVSELMKNKIVIKKSIQLKSKNVEEDD